MKGHVWEQQEVVLEARGTYANPYVDVEVWVDLEGPDFSKRCYGFWDGEKTFRVRILATKAGKWLWRSGSNQDDDGLNGERGSFEAVDWSEAEKRANPNRRGFIKATANGHALEYADGTPFLLLADTMWAIPTFRFPWYDDDREKAPGPDMGFKDMIRYRKRQGFNSVAILACFPNWAHDGKPARLTTDDGTVLRSGWPHPGDGQGRDMQNEGGRAFHFPGKIPGLEEFYPDVERINPEYFRYLDRKMDFLQKQGFVPFLEVLRRDASQAWKKFYPWPESYAHYILYVFARYQAQNVILSPIHFDIEKDSIPSRDFLDPANLVHERYGPPPFGNLVSTNAGPSTLCQFGHVEQAPWLTMHQIGNMREHDYYWYLTEIYHKKPPLPALHGEPYYSGWGTQATRPYAYGAPGNTEQDDRQVRSGMYGSFLSGGLAGFIYGATGLIRAAREEEYTVKIWEGLQFRSADMIAIFRDFVFCEGDRYRDLVPGVDFISPNRDHNVLSYEGWAYCARTPERDLFLMYFEKSIAAGYVRAALHNAEYKADWYDVRTGEWVDAGVLISTQLEMINLPEKPDEQDWAMRLKLQSD